MWKKVLLVPIPKQPGTKHIDQLRPIQLLETTRKVWFSFIWRRKIQTLRRKKAICSSQYGSQRACETAQPLQQLIASIEAAHVQAKELHIISVDMRRAFDFVPRRVGMQLALHRFGLDKELVQKLVDTSDHHVTSERSRHWEQQSLTQQALEPSVAPHKAELSPRISMCCS